MVDGVSVSTTSWASFMRRTKLHYSRLVGFMALTLVTSASLAASKPFIEDFLVSTDFRYELIDDRPQQEKDAARGSSNRQSCDFGIWRIGDEEIVPSRIDYLKSRLQREVKPERLVGTVVRVKEYSVFFNQQLSARAASGRIQFNSRYDSSLGRAMTELLQSFECWAGPQTASGYDLLTNPRAQPVGIVAIRLEIGTKFFESRYSFIPGADDQHLPIGGTALIRAVDKLIEAVNGAK